MSQERWVDALRLQETPGLGLRRCRALLDVWGDCEAVLQAPDADLRDALSVRQFAALRQAPPDWGLTLERVRHWLSAAPPGQHHAVLAWGDADYPPALAQLPDPPLVLFVAGARCEDAWRWGPGVALVGSRGATPQGMALARQWGLELADAGWCVVSGLAHGIDAAAHLGALQSTRQTCPTWAIMGTGPDLVYPASNAGLKERILARGRCVTEYLPGTLARRPHFPLRNRLLAALSEGVVVIEADAGSGSLISAQCALEQGREVMAVPGSVRSPLSRGCHALLRQGATLVECTADILHALRPAHTQASAQVHVQAELTLAVPAGPKPLVMGAGGVAAPQNADEPMALSVAAALGHDPLPVEVLCQRLGCGMAELSACLLSLEWQGRLARLPGDRVQWVSP
jgi:DNA processing protein